MREALSSLTTRGRGFVAAGLTALACAVVLGQDDLVRIGTLLVLLPLIAAFVMSRSRYRLGLVRSVAPVQVSAGQEARVQLDLTNEGRLPTGILLLEDEVPYVLGTRPRFVIDRMGARWNRRVKYVVRSDVRGKFFVGPLTVRLSDPFGMVELDRTFTSRSSLVVTPPVTPLPPIPLSGAWTGSGDNRPRAFASGSAEDVTVREYRRGDDLRRVHWRSSARVGELMVRREEQPWQSRATVFLDTRASAHRGRGAASSLEHAVGVAASVAVHLVHRGFVVRLVTAAGEEQGGSWHERGGAAGEAAPLLESLAVVAAESRSHLDTRWLQEPGHTGLLVAVVGTVHDHDRPALARMRHTAATTMAFVLDVDAWGAGRGSRDDEGREARDLATLRGLGWHGVGVGPRSSTSAAWQELSLNPGRPRHGAGAPSVPSSPSPRAVPPVGGAR